MFDMVFAGYNTYRMIMYFWKIWTSAFVDVMWWYQSEHDTISHRKKYQIAESE